jgi:hypothetical protein
MLFVGDPEKTRIHFNSQVYVCEASLIIPHQNPMEKEPKGGGAHIRPLYHTMFLIYQSFVGGKNKNNKESKRAP